jgi:anhydro-N-acetylmuramic acid kinase
MSATLRYVAGGMSGTSADGVDVAIVAVEGRGYDMTARLCRHHHRPYNAALRREIFAFRGDGGGDGGGSVSQDTLRRLARLGREISLTYATAVNEALAAAHLEAKNLAAIAAHGQTLFHDPPDTIQWLDPSLIAAEVGCAVVSDFRRADLAARGQGAPLVPFADFILFRDAKKNRVLLNIGGIANVTYIPAGASIDHLIAFDTGPGNCVSDYLCRREFPDGPGYDDNGSIARRGQPSRDALQYLITTDYFRQKPPKSTDGPAMIALFESAKEARNLPFVDRVATALLFCISSIQQQMKLHLPGNPDELIVSGGGTRNFVMMHHLRAGFAGAVKTSDDLGTPSEAKEAVAFALLGAATLDGVPSNVPSVTGAKRPVVLGSITPRP